MKTELKLAVVQTALLTVCALLLLVIAVRQRNTRLENVLEYEALSTASEHLAKQAHEQRQFARDEAASDDPAEKLKAPESRKLAEHMDALLTELASQRNASESKVIPLKR